MAKEITCDRGNCQKHFAPITMMDVYYEVAESGRNENQHICVECITAAEITKVVCPVCHCPRNGSVHHCPGGRFYGTRSCDCHESTEGVLAPRRPVDGRAYSELGIAALATIDAFANALAHGDTPASISDCISVYEAKELLIRSILGTEFNV